ncbi:hypothetical protein [Devosia submarina]|uniref:hypothetical protein n=1 Tax=Devosia submarina TaxID=1173082 RepID=UPI000D377F31|nr:hypothetical protein [Devosia submarina]
MRDLLRLLGLAILVFAIVGFAMIYSRDSAFRYGVTAFVSGASGAVSRGFVDLTGFGRGESTPQLETTTLRIARARPADWVGLTGYGDRTTVPFSVPLVGSYVDGQLDLRFDAQLAQGSTGLLSIAVNGRQRSEIVIDTGHNAYDVTIPLTQSDLLANTVLVELTSRGTGNDGQMCPSEAANAGIAISLLPESAIVLTTLQAERDPQTALIAAADPLNIYLGEDPEDQIVAVWGAQHMARAGVSAILVEDKVTPGRVIVTDNATAPNPVELDSGGNIVLNGLLGLRRAIEFRRAETRDLFEQWPIPAAGLTKQTMARNFNGTESWTVSYPIADLPGGLTPTSFELALRASQLADGNEWIVRVSLNGNLLQTARLPGNVPDISLAIDLPVALQGLNNTIEVELVDTSPVQGACRAAPDARAQLMPQSRLVASASQPSTGWGALVRRLATASFVTPGNQAPLNATQATRLATALAQFLPVEANVTFQPEAPPMTLTALSKDKLAEMLQQPQASAPDQDAWIIISRGGTAADSLNLHDLKALDPASVLERMHSTSLAILVQSPSPQ